MSDLLAFPIDTESEAGAPIAKQYNVNGLPALLFLNSDGSVRDLISGYLPPEPFLEEVQRIKRNEDTISGYRKKVEADPDDLYARYKFAQKLESVGDLAGAKAQKAEIRKRDPEGKTVASRRLKFEEAMARVQNDLDPGPIYALAEKETDQELLFDIWYVIWRVEAFLMDQNEGEEGDSEAFEAHRVKWLAAARSVWSHTKEEEKARFGNELAWSFWEGREHLEQGDKTFALEIASGIAKASPDDASVLDTYACILFLNDKVEQAIATSKRAISLDPDNEEWKARLAIFEAALTTQDGKNG